MRLQEQLFIETCEKNMSDEMDPAKSKRNRKGDDGDDAEATEEPPKKLVKVSENDKDGDDPLVENGGIVTQNDAEENSAKGEEDPPKNDKQNQSSPDKLPVASSVDDSIPNSQDAHNANDNGSNPGQHPEVNPDDAPKENQEDPIPETTSTDQANESPVVKEQKDSGDALVSDSHGGTMHAEASEVPVDEKQQSQAEELVGTSESTTVETTHVSSSKEHQISSSKEESELHAPKLETPEVGFTLDYAAGVPTEPSPEEFSYDASAAQASPSNNPNSNPESGVVEERGEVPAIYIGRVIGKGGEMIRDLQARAGCRMDVDPNAASPGASRIITYRGTRKTVDFAKRLVQMLCSDNVAEADLPLGEAHRKLLVIPAHTVGKIIGRGGEMIRELQVRSQARIQVDHTGTSGLDPGQKQVTITGSEPAVVKAEEMVLFLVNNPMMDALQSLNMLVEDKLHRGGTWGSGPPYPNLPNQGQNMQPAGAPSGPMGYGGAGYEQPPPANYPPTYSPQQQQQHQTPAMAAAPMPGYNSYGGPPPVGPEIELFRTPRLYLGRIIGAKGVTINDLQRRSGCDIQINQDVPHGQDCEISIRGARSGIEMVKQMIREIIDIGPNHPYAGGADQAGFQQGSYSQGGYQQGGYGYPPQPYGYQNPMAPPGYGQPYEPPYQTPYPAYGAGYDQRSMGGYYPPVAMHQPYPAATQSPYAYEPPQHQAPSSASAWKSATAPDGQVYYYNERTGETQWEKPMGYP